MTPYRIHPKPGTTPANHDQNRPECRGGSNHSGQPGGGKRVSEIFKFSLIAQR
jgi:hypothetical protein